MPRYKRDVAELKSRAISSLVLGIELFNRPHGRGRSESVIIFLHHAFEMLFKAIIKERTGTIHEKGAKYSYSFAKCLKIAKDSINLISADEQAALSILDVYRDTTVHYYQDVSENLLYVQAQSAVTLFNDLLIRVFQESLADIIPKRVLPISTSPPRDLNLLVGSELNHIDQLLYAGSRKGIQAMAKLRPIIAMVTAVREDSDRVSENEVKKAIERRRQGDEWSVILPEVAQLRIETQGEGIGVYLRIKKDASSAVRIAKEGEPVVGTLIKQEINIWDKYNLGRNDLAQKLGISGPKTSTLIIELKIQEDPECFKILRRKKSTFKGYSKKALTKLQTALENDIDIDVIWEKNKMYYNRRKLK